jgi:hypothetical protein
MANEITGLATVSTGQAIRYEQTQATASKAVSARLPIDEVVRRAEPSLDGQVTRRLEVGDQVNRVATDVRAIDSGADGFQHMLFAMRDALSGIVKQYPPFPPDSRQRVDYLNNFSNLRKEIAALTFPAPEPFPPEVTTDATVVPGADVAKKLKEIADDLPKLGAPAETSDAEVTDALSKIQEALTRVAEQKSMLWEDVVKFVGEIPDSEARSNSAESRKQLADAGRFSLAKTDSFLERESRSQGVA